MSGSDKKDRKRRGVTAFQFARRWLFAHWFLLALSVAFSVVTAIAASSYGVLMKQAGQWLREGDPMVLWMPLVSVLAATVRGVSKYGHEVSANMAVQRGLFDLQAQLFRRLNESDYSFLRRESSAESLSRFINDVNLLREAAVRVACDFPRAVLTVFGCVVVMVWMEWALSLFLLVLYPVTILPVLRLGGRVRKTSAAAQTRTGAVASLLSESFREARLIRAFNLQDYQQKRVEAGILERMRLLLVLLRQQRRISMLMEIVGGIAFGAIVFFVGWRVLSGESTVEAFLGFIVVLTVASPEIRALGSMTSVVNEGLAAVDRVEAVLASGNRVIDRAGLEAPQRLRGEVEISQVGFSYGHLPVLEGLSLKVEAGQTLALVGASGAGKSTLFDLLLRLYDPDSGQILFDGKDVRDFPVSFLRRNLALVSQEASLFDDSLAANIALGRPDASRKEIEEAAQAASCDFIEDLPGGLDAVVGEGGGKLSGGQRQRVCIARALLRDAPILLLDEATSALDAENEARVQQALQRLRSGRTTLVIAHHLSTVRSADSIAVMEKGMVVESGDHESLLSRGGVYAELAGIQFRRSGLAGGLT